jgi:ribosomal protein S18 acetylase RimI-like enzyme
MGECFNTKKYSAPTNDHLWLIVFSRKKMAGFLVLDENNTIWNVCVAKNYRNQGIASEIIKQAVNYTCNIRGNNPTLLVDNLGETAKKLIKMYTGFGFKVIKTTDKHTYMSHSCKDV